MKTLKEYWFMACCALSILVSPSSYAAKGTGGVGGAVEIFDPLTDKTEDLSGVVTTWAAAVSLLVIVIFGVMVMMGKLSKFWGACIVGGGLIILTGSGISSFLLNE